MRQQRYTIDLSRHLAQCDGNYQLFTRLMPDISPQAAAGGRIDGRRTLHLRTGDRSATVTVEVEDRSRFTSVATLSMPALPALPRTAAQERRRAAPPPLLSLKVRLYHDTRSAEVIEFQGERGFEAVYPYPNPQMRQADEKAQVNRFLAEFLDACLRHGAAAEQPTALADSS